MCASGLQKIILLVLLSLLPVLLCVWPAQVQPPGQPPKESVADLIKLLASEKFKERDKAAKELVGRKGANLALQQALKGNNLEGIRRIEGVLKERAQRQAQRALARLKVAAKAGAVDEVAELLALWPAGFEDDACYQEVRQLVLALVGLHQKQGGKANARFLKGTEVRKLQVFSGERVTEAPFTGRTDIFIRAVEVNVKLTTNVIAGCSSSFRCRTFMDGAIFSAGSVEVGSLLGDTVIVSDGDVKVGNAGHCLIIARGTVTCDGPIGDCQIISGKRVVSTKNGWLSNCTVTEGEPTPLRFVTFFNLREKGVVVETAAGGARVVAVIPDFRFERAGLKQGDVIVAVDGQKVDTEETFRRLLRHSYIVNDGTTLRILRAGKAQELWVDTVWE